MTQATPPAKPTTDNQRGVLAWIERVGNLLPDPVMIFVWLIGFLMLLSVIGAGLGWQASLPFTGDKPPAGGVLKDGVLTFEATSLFTEDNLKKLFVDMPRTLTGFAPLGTVLVVMLGAAVAERAGLFSALIRNSLTGLPRHLLTPVVCIIGMMSHHASDAGYVVFIPLAGLVYAAAGRHPLVGIGAAFAAVSGGFAGNITPGQLDVLLFGFTQEAARIIDPTWTMNPLGNWWFILAIVVVFTPIIWFITDRVLEPRLGPWGGEPDADLKAELAKSEVTKDEKRGLGLAGLSALVIIALFTALSLWPGFTPLIDESQKGTAQLQPFYQSLIAAFSLMFLAAGISYGIAVKSIKTSTDVVTMMADGIRSLAPYIVFAFFAAHFIAMFNWSNLGPIAAINGAEALKALSLPAPFLLVCVQVFSSILDLFIGSASAKWSAMAPVVVPMFMLLGISPEMTTAAYRMGDSYTNIATPLMSYFPLVLAFCRRWDKNVGVGTLLAMMLPFAFGFLIAGTTMTAAWVYFDWPLGPGAQVTYALPGSQ
ncbi:p-aminobenzoyl-glutamate transport protein [Candidatus Phycosocius bacilliformis]|uniref:p-aminobenzoyl-glutamate transport protein n=1 Tax=Candidatus Phycosocius bacilliformis TaxID=1445552 RepID=A0A2P2E6D4_9PROT|nr:AbgT family transporter [Candidatus Phycosocius bacilliformis]GBF56635.1 p-aminobenzoyl-glutamate transport protein [Candidatus Phycosocius bacilliformis]